MTRRTGIRGGALANGCIPRQSTRPAFSLSRRRRKTTQGRVARASYPSGLARASRNQRRVMRMMKVRRVCHSDTSSGIRTHPPLGHRNWVRG